MGEANTNETDFEISVIDVNDNSPSFDKKNYVATVAETAKIGTNILSSKINDIDEDQKFRFDISNVTLERISTETL